VIQGVAVQIRVATPLEVAQFGKALGSGPRNRRFKSCLREYLKGKLMRDHPNNQNDIIDIMNKMLLHELVTRYPEYDPQWFFGVEVGNYYFMVGESKLEIEWFDDEDKEDSTEWECMPFDVYDPGFDPQEYVKKAVRHIEEEYSRKFRCRGE
jgi:hypothetical protein